MAIPRKVLCFILLIILILINIFTIGTTADDQVQSDGPKPLGTLPRSIKNDMWPMFRGDVTRTGNTTAIGPDYFYQLWSASTGVWWGSCVVMYDQIYVSYNGGTRCYDMTGSVKWTYSTGSQYSTPLVHNGRVYIVAGTGPLICVDANATGSGTTTLYWTYRPSGVTFAASSAVTDGKKIYYATQHSSGLHAVWINNGTKAWNASLGGSTATESSPSYWNGRVYCGGGYSYTGGSTDVYCFNASSGNLSWSFKTGGDVCGTPAIAYGRVYFGSLDGKVYCVDAIGSNGTTTKHWEYNVVADVYGSAAVGYGRIYIGDNNNYLHCFDALATGGSTTRYWVQQITPTSIYGVCSSPAITKDRIYIGNAANSIHCRNRTTGGLVWSHSFGTATYGISSSPAVYKEKLFLTSDNGNLYGLGLDKVPPKMLSSNPEDDDLDVDMYQNISLKFDEDLDTSTLINSNIYLTNSSLAQVPGKITSDMSTEMVYFSPDQPLEKDEIYTFTITGAIKDIHSNGFDANGNGIAEGVGIDDLIITFKTIPFYPPKIGNLAIPTLTEDVPFSVNISSAITDDDTPKYKLTLSEDSEYASLKGYVFEFLYPEGVTSDLINLSVSDGLFTVWKKLPIKINPVNDLPVLSEIPQITVNEDETYILDMKKYVTDIDTPLDNLNLYVFSQNYSSKSGYVQKDGLSISLTYPNGIFSDIINVTVYEGDLTDGQAATTEFYVKVLPMNDKPELAEPLSELRMNEDETDDRIRLRFWFKDIDSDTLSYSYSGNQHINLTVDIKGDVELEPQPNWFGNEVITFTATDSDQAKVSSNITIIVDPVNDPPIIEKITSPNDGDIFEFEESFDLNALVTDVDLITGDELTFYWESSEDGGIGYEQSVTGVVLTPGTHTITLTVEDKEKADAVAEITITVKPEDIQDTDGDNIPDNIDDDDDGDNIPDSWEAKYSSILDPLDPTDAAEDPDNDGYSNLKEYLGPDGKPGGSDSSDPTSKSSIPKSKTEDTDKDSITQGTDLTLIAVIGVVIVIIILVVIFAVVRKRRKSIEKEDGKTQTMATEIQKTMDGQPPVLDQLQTTPEMPMPMPIQTPMDMQMQVPMQPFPVQLQPGFDPTQQMMGYGVGVQSYPDNQQMYQQQMMAYDQYAQTQGLEQNYDYTQPQLHGQGTEFEQLPPAQELDAELTDDELAGNMESELDTPSPERPTTQDHDPDDVLGKAKVFTLPPQKDDEESNN